MEKDWVSQNINLILTNMNKEQIISATIAYAKEALSGEGSGHDWFHVERVWKMAKRLAEKEHADLFIVEMAALLHDIADWKLNDGDEKAGLKKVVDWLEKCCVAKEDAEKILFIIDNMSFSKEIDGKKLNTVEGFVVQDADRLDAIGAIGIARTFAFGGSRGRLLHNPEEDAREIKTFSEYKNSQSTSINHFHEKLFLLKDQMNTQRAKEIAEKRHGFMQQFLEEFLQEWNGEM